jgi:diaminopimelate epimerase
MNPQASTPIALTKHHGLGNDFLVAIDPPRPLEATDARSWCNRREGIGADGLIMATPLDDPRHWRMVLWNSDGGRAEISGNGIRCLAQALADHLGHDRAVDLSLLIETDAGSRQVVVQARTAVGGLSNGADASTDRVRAAMGQVGEGPVASLRLGDLGLDVVDQVGVDLGNPHLVVFVDSLEGIDVATVGPAVEADYPAGVNVHFVRPLDERRIEMLIWERGAGATQACGSGACAAAVAAFRAGLVGVHVDVVMPGGSAQVEVAGDEVTLTGPAVRVAGVTVGG